MSRTLQFRRYNTATLANTTGADGELIVNTDNHTLTVHDGALPGGYALLNSQTDNNIDQVARNTANSATTLAQSAYNYANTIVSDTQIDPVARATANSAAANTILIQGVNLTQNTNITNATNLAQAAFDQANTGGGITANSVATLTNKTFDVSIGSNNTFSIQGQSIASYSGSGQVVLLQNSPTISVLNLRDSNLNLDGGSGSFYWQGQSGVAQAGDLKAGAYSSDPTLNNSLFTFGGSGANNMSVSVEGSLFIGTALPSNNGGLNTTYPGWLVVQSGAKFGGTINTLGALQFDDPATGKIIFTDFTEQTTAYQNIVWQTANSAANLAQAAYNTANTKLNLTGGTITGNLVISGKSTFSGVAETFSGLVDATGVVVHDCSTGRIFSHTSIDNNFTANFTNLNLNSGEATTLTLVLNQGGTAYIANSVQIGGVAQTIKWSANTVPTGNTNAVDVQSFSVLNSSGTYTVLGQLSTFG